MKKLISCLLVPALSASACAQMPAALINGRGPAILANVDRLTLIPQGGDFLVVMPRKASDPCPAFARFRFVTTDVTVQSAAIVSTIGWQKGATGATQPICHAVLRAEQIPFMPRPELRMFASVQANKTESMSVEVRSVCSTDTCLLLPPGQSMGSSDTTTKINREIEALQGQVSKAWNATVGKLTQQASSTECDTTSQTCQTQAGTVGESIKTQNLIE